MGVEDPERIGVIGHSHGALMTANLLAHSDLFRAGIARSGSHNKSLTALGFQNERRTLWEARDTISRFPLCFLQTRSSSLSSLFTGRRMPIPERFPCSRNDSMKLSEALAVLCDW